MRKSVARKITIPFFLVFLSLTLILYFVGYLLLNDLVLREIKSNLRSCAVDMKIRLEDESVPTEATLLKKFESEGFAFCMSYDIDYISLYIPNENGNQVTYKAVVNNVGTHLYNDVSDARDLVIDYELEPAEQRVWDDVESIDYMHWKGFVDEECVVVKIYGPEGTEYLMSVDKSFDYIRSLSFRTFIGVAILVLILFVAMSVVLYFVIRKRVSKPAASISTAMEKFVVNGERKEIKLEENQNDEFGIINRAFNKMADDIDNYVNNISSLSSEQERHKAEIDIAAKIQQGFLPSGKSNFGPIDIRSMMTPARDIGGDMYDYKKLDDTHYYMMIADVVGKGISASLYMSVLLTCLRQSVTKELDPSVILENANNYLAEKNPESVFITAFVSIYDSEKNTLTYANAGHNPPYLISDKLTRLDKSEGTVLGLFENEKYENAVIELKAGDRLFLYTDGVTEAQNSENRFYTEARLESFLTNYKGNDLLSGIMNELSNFVGDQVQSDDITMLTALIKDPENKDVESNGSELMLHGTEPEFAKIREMILASDIPEDVKLPLCLSAEEIYVNICSYAFTGVSGSSRKVIFSMTTGDDVVMTFRDNGTPYNPLEDMKDNEALDEYDPEEDEGGLGKFIAFNIADDAGYEYMNGENILTITKTLKGE